MEGTQHDRHLRSLTLLPVLLDGIVGFVFPYDGEAVVVPKHACCTAGPLQTLQLRTLLVLTTQLQPYTYMIAQLDTT